MKKIVKANSVVEESLVGGKFGKQTRMIRSGIPVPDFFCLTRHYYEDAFLQIKTEVSQVLTGIDFEDRKSIKEAAGAIQLLFMSIVLEEQQISEIHRIYDENFKPSSLVSVRSSMVGYKQEESEDSSDNPFAGISKSFLYVTKDQLIEKVKDCWSSGYSEEALIYRHTQSMDLLGFSVAVGVQQMVMGERSFVMFTANPNTASKDMIIIAGHGIGEGVVQEQVEVDHYFINEKTQAIKKEIVEKKYKIVFDEQKGSGLKREALRPQQSTEACLDDLEIRKLKAYGQQIEKVFGEPQDIEGTITADGGIQFLQSRPIAIDYSKIRIWTNTNVTESFPGVTTVLTYSFAKFFYREIFYDSYLRLGVSRKKLKENFDPLNQMIGFLEGRIYYNLSHFYLLHQQSPLFPIFREHWENTIGLQSSYNAVQHKGFFSSLKKIKKKAQFAAAAVHTIKDYLSHHRKMDRFYNWWEGLMKPVRGKDLKGEDPSKLLRRFQDLWAEVGNHWGTTLTNDAYLIILYGFVENRFKKWGLDKKSGLLSDLLCGDESLTSVEILLSALNLAEEVRESPELLSQFKNQSEDELMVLLEKNRFKTDFQTKIEEHLHDYGDRGLQELKLEVASMRDDPRVLLRSIKQFALQHKTVDSIRTHEQKVRDEAETELKALLKGRPLKFRIVMNLLRRLRRLVRDRENSRYCRSELFGLSRNIFKALGAYLVSRNALENQSDIYHLTQEEIFGYIDGSGYTHDLQSLVNIRKKEFEQNQQKNPKDDITTFGAIRDNELNDYPSVSEAEGDADGRYQGLGSSIGRVTGRARVVTDPSAVSAILKDEILIAKETDPGWLFLMLASKGMVVERGSMLSHTAITGRKFGIPTVVALRNATKVIPDGAWIEIDGGSGEVQILNDN